MYFKHLLMVVIIALIGACASMPSEKSYLIRSEGGSFSNPYGVTYIIHIGEYNENDVSPQKLRNYIEYLMNYRGFKYTDKEDEAQYFIEVNYQGVSSNSKEQILTIAAYSKRVLKAKGSVNPSWFAKTSNLGYPKDTDKILRMLVLAMREYIGRNPTLEEEYKRINPSNSELISIISSVSDTI